jgi:hypothetical protein
VLIERARVQEFMRFILEGCSRRNLKRTVQQAAASDEP